MCINEPKYKENKDYSWNISKWFLLVAQFGPICTAVHCLSCLCLFDIQSTAVSRIISFIFGGLICTEILWLNDLQEQCIKKNNRKYVQRAIDKMLGSRRKYIMFEYGFFVSKKASHENSNVPLLIAVGSLCISVLNAVNGNVVMLLVLIFFLLLVFGFSEQKRLHAIEDAVKEYAFKEAMK